MASSTQTWPRVVDLEGGTAVVVTDLHGDWDAYQRYRDQFMHMQASGQADYFCLLGDLIHRSSPPAEDQSLEIVLDLLTLQKELGDKLICLLGNHELAHIYAVPLAKGSELYTPRFEHAMGSHRADIIAFFNAMPFYIRTKAGVTLAHAGATAAIGEENARERLFTYSHQEILDETAVSLPMSARPQLRKKLAARYATSYDALSRTYFAVTPQEFHRYDDFLIGSTALETHPDCALLWPALFNKNELEYGRATYLLILDTMLREFSKDTHSQRVMVTGHIDVKGGHALIGQQQLRLASGKHASSRRKAQYLLLDCEQPVENAESLLPNLGAILK